MTGPAPLRSYLGRIAAPSPLPEAEYEAMRARCWAERGLIVIAPQEITNDYVRQGLISEASKRWGRRMKR